MMKLTFLAAPALALAAFVSDSVSAATITCAMPISRGSGGVLYDVSGGHRRFEYCTADGFTGEANVLRFEINPATDDDSQLWLTVKKTAGAGNATLTIANGALGTIVPSTGGSCTFTDALGGGSTGTTTNPCVTNVNVENLYMRLEVAH